MRLIAYSRASKADRGLLVEKEYGGRSCPNEYGKERSDHGRSHRKKKTWIQITRIFQTKKRLTNQKVVPRKTSRTTRPECPEMRFSRVCPLPCHTASILCGNGRRVGCRVGPTSRGYRHAYTAYGKTDTYLKQRMHTTTTTTKCSSVQHCNIQHAT